MTFPYLTVDPRVAMGTGALVRPITVETGSSIEARFRVTLIDIVLAVAASESRETQAGECIDSVHASATIEARAAETWETIFLHITLLTSFVQPTFTVEQVQTMYIFSR